MISIIVPVYNVSIYLPKCIESILHQSYSNFELILVDDGSTDESGKICDSYGQSDSRIKVIHKPNGGLSSARNAGINIARGEYYAFIDSDDYVDSKFIEYLYSNAIEKNADICECSFSYLKNGKIFHKRLFDCEVLDNETAVRRLFAPPYQSVINTWNKIYKKDLFKKIRFPEGKLHEDEFTTYKLLYESNRIAYINQCLYTYRIRNNSITTSGFSYKRAEALLESIEERKKYFYNCNIDMNEELGFSELVAQLNILNMMVDSKCYDIVLWNKITSGIKKNKKELFQNSYLKSGHKLYIITMMMGRWVYITFRKCVNLERNKLWEKCNDR